MKNARRRVYFGRLGEILNQKNAYVLTISCSIHQY